MLFSTKKLETGTVHRYCGNLSKDATIESFSCAITTFFSTGNSHDVKYDTAEICKPCADRDGCNGAPSQYGQIAALIAIAMATIKILTF